MLTKEREKLAPNFFRDEFACRCGCGFDAISLKLVDMLQDVRDEIGYPLKITSACRCISHNESVGGILDSSHLPGDAVDINCFHSAHRMMLLPVLCRTFRRIIVYETFIHVDIDPTKDQDILCLG